MSAYIVENETINKIIAFLEYDEDMRHQLKHDGILLDTLEQRESLGNRLFRMNVDAVNARYGQGKEFRPLDYKYKEIMPKSIFCTLKGLQCLLYQCSEGDIDTYPLYQKMRDIEKSLMHKIIDHIPKYNEAKWG